MPRPALMVHGGAGAKVLEVSALQEAGCRAAINAGWSVLVQRGSALDAVCEAVAVLEDDPLFNAGRGSVLTVEGTVEMDASVMEGTRLRAGAVAVVRTICNPVRLARFVLDDGHHVLLAGSGAEAFALSKGMKACPASALITERQLDRWRQRSQPAAAGTVGAVAVDVAGGVAAATSTGGVSHKLPGRVGDSAVIGAGTYADDELGAASATGIGEAIIRVGLARAVVHGLRDGADPGTVARDGLRALDRRAQGTGGIIVADRLGRLGYAYTTPHMTFGYMHMDLAAPVVHA